MKTVVSSKIFHFVLGATLGCGLGFLSPASANSYLIDLNSKTVTDLGNVDARAINDNGQVAGNLASPGGEVHAFFTGPDGLGITDLGALGGDWSTAVGINQSGQLVGSSTTTRGLSYAFLTGPNGLGVTPLQTGDDLVAVSPSGINDRGQVVGDIMTWEGTFIHSSLGQTVRK